MTKRILNSMLLLCTVAAPATAQTAALSGASKWADSASREIEAASDAGDIARLKNAQILIDRALAAFPNDALLLHYKGYALHREAGLQEGLGNRDAVRPLLEDAVKALEASIKVKPMAESHALLASMLGRQIGFQWYKAFILGPQSGQEMTTAIALGPDNPRVWLLRGTGAMFTPAAFGGGLDKAEAYLKKAEQLFVKDHPVAPAPSWGRAEVYAWLGQIYQRQKKTAEAVAAYNKALEINPDFRWVKFVLLPSAQGR